VQDTVEEAGLPRIPPINPAASPEKQPGPPEAPPPAPACKTVLLPTLEQAEDVDTGAHAAADPAGRHSFYMLYYLQEGPVGQGQARTGSHLGSTDVRFGHTVTN